MTNKLIKHALPLSIIIFLALFILLFPFYQYIFDQDSIGYSAVAERVAAGEYYKSINGLWSPMSSWLAVPLIKSGVDTIIAFKYLNGFIGVLLLFFTSKLINRFIIVDWLKAIILYTCVPIFLSYCFYELCADFLLLLFFVLYLIQITAANFFENKKRIIFCSLIAALAYFSKAYFFPFFFAHFILINFFYFKKYAATNWIKKILQNIATGFVSFIIFCSPWIYALFSKYHYLTYSNAGKYNAYLHLHTNSLYPKVLVAPPYPDSLNSWDDPWQPFMQKFSAFTSPETFIKQIKLFFINLTNTPSFFTEISFLSIVIIASLIFLLAAKKINFKIPDNIILLTITAILMPTGYLLFHLENRFIWIESILCLIIGGYLITALFNYFNSANFQKIFLTTIFIVSFLISPLQALKNGINDGREPYTIAALLKKNNINGKVICNYINLDQYTQVLMANVIAKNQFYNYSGIDFSEKDVIGAIKEFDIDYYIFSYNNDFEKETFLSSDIYKNAIRVIPDFYPRLIVLKLK